MKKQIIDFNVNSFNEDKKYLLQSVESINKIIPELIANGITDISMDTIRNIHTNYDKFILDIRDRHIDNFKEKFGMDLGSPFIDIANKAVENIKNIKLSVKSKLSMFYGQFIMFDGYLTIENNECKLCDTALDKLKEKYTYYTETDKQNKANEIMQSVLEKLNELEDMGISSSHFVRPAIIYKGADNKLHLRSGDFLNATK